MSYIKKVSVNEKRFLHKNAATGPDLTALKQNTFWRHGPQIAANMWPILSDYRYKKMCRLVVQVQQCHESRDAVVGLPSWIYPDSRQGLQLPPVYIWCEHGVGASGGNHSHTRLCHSLSQRHHLLHPVSAHQYTLCFLQLPGGTDVRGLRRSSASRGLLVRDRDGGPERSPWQCTASACTRYGMVY